MKEIPNTNLLALPNTNSGFGFFNLSTGQGNDTANSIALCRGDVNPDVCLSCLNDSIVKLREICPNQKEAIGYYDYCMLKYSNENILRNTRIRLNTQNASNQVGFNRALRPLLNRLRSDVAAEGPLLKFATGNTTGPEFETIYGIVQCTPDLIEQECSACLEDAIGQFWNSYGAKIGGRTLLPTCNFRYEIRQFYNGSTLVIPPPSSSSPPPPTLPHLHHHHHHQYIDKMKTTTSTTSPVISSGVCLRSISPTFVSGHHLRSPAPTFVSDQYLRPSSPATIPITSSDVCLRSTFSTLVSSHQLRRLSPHNISDLRLRRGMGVVSMVSLCKHSIYLHLGGVVSHRIK